jgi:hypothetical protein
MKQYISINIFVVIIVAMVMLTDFGPNGIMSMTVCYYFRFPVILDGKFITFFYKYM